MTTCEHAKCGAEAIGPGRRPNGWLRLDVAGSAAPSRFFCTAAHLIAFLTPDVAQARAVRRREGVAQLLREGRSVSQIAAATGEPAVWVKGVLDELRAQQVHA